MNSLSDRLTRWRLSKGWTQAELARRARIPRPNLIALELGRRDCTVGTLVKLAQALGTTPGKLLDAPPPGKPLRLSRFERDTLARIMIGTKMKASSRLQRCASDLQPLFRPCLEAAGCLAHRKRASFVRRVKFNLEKRYSKELIRDVGHRIRKYLPLLSQPVTS